jgi:dihydroneopterin aldolase
LSPARARRPAGPKPSKGLPDTIFVHDLEVRCVIGVDAWERRAPQTVALDIEIACDASRAAASDDVADAVNYRTVAKEAQAYVARSSFRLVETLAVRLADHLRRRCRLPWIRLRVRKPGAVRFSRDVGVEVERGARA